MPHRANVQEPPQTYDTYLDKSTGHQRLRGGALLIKDPDWTEEQAKEAETPFNIVIESDAGSKTIETVLPAFVHQVVRKELGLKGKIEVHFGSQEVTKACTFLDIGAIDGASLTVTVVSLKFSLKCTYTMHHAFKPGSCIPDEDHPDWFPPTPANDTEHELILPDLEKAWEAVTSGGKLTRPASANRGVSAISAGGSKELGDRITKLEVFDNEDQPVALALLDELIAEKHDSHSAETGTTFATVVAR